MAGMGGPGKKTVLSDRFLVGEELGRGAYGQVYKGIDLTRGDLVAIKQISLTGVSQEHLQGVMGEIELLKTLNHTNIVKYLGSFKTKSHLYIILEFMENGALSSIIKPNKFGVFPEPLVAVYISQVLQGLRYLHEQGVVHRDIKGANILTTKEGLVKLADFGVAAKLGELEEHSDELHQNVVGTPYWMAPEIIEMTQVTPASDIWSVGCLIVELLTGSPPYFEMQPMSALFRIVSDEHPPLPDSLSPLAEDFLRKCFQKDPKMRPDAQALLQHEWLKYHHKTLRHSWSRTQGRRGGSGGGRTDAHESVSSVVERILAETVTDPADGGKPDLPGAGAEAHRSAHGAHAAPSPHPLSPGARSPTAATAAMAAAAAGPADASLAGNAALEAAAAATAVAEQAGEPALAPTGRPPSSMTARSDGEQMEAYPLLGQGRGEVSGRYPPGESRQRMRGPRHHPGAMSWDGVTDEGLSPLSSPLPPMPGGASSKHLRVPWMAYLPTVPQRAEPDSPGAGGTSLLARLQGGSTATPPAMGQGAAHSLLAWLEDAEAGVGADRKLAVRGGADSLLASRESSLSAAYETSDNSFAMESRRKVQQLVRCMRVGSRDASVGAGQACAALSALLPKQAELKSTFVAEGGTSSLMELLDSDNTKHLEAAVELACALCAGDPAMLDCLCAVGAVPSVCRLLSLPHPPSLRRRAAVFVRLLVGGGAAPLQALLTCQGLRHVVAVVQDNLAEPASLSPWAVGTLWMVLEVYGPLPLNFLCRTLVQFGLAQRLLAVCKQLSNPQLRAGLAKHQRSPSLVASAGGADGPASPPPPLAPRLAVSPTPLQRGAAGGGSASAASLMPGGGREGSGAAMPWDPGAPLGPPGATAAQQADLLLDRVVGLLQVLAHCDSSVKACMCQRDSLQALLECCQRLQAPQLARALRVLRRLCGDAGVVADVKDAGALTVLVPFLSRDWDSPPRREAQHEALHALYLICKFNKKVHLEVAAAAGAVPHLCRFAQELVAGDKGVIEGGDAGQRDTLTPTAGSNGPGSTGGIADGPGPGPGSDPGLGPGASTSPGPMAAAAAGGAAARWSMLRMMVVPLLMGMVKTSASTRAKMWASSGLDILLQMLSMEDSAVQLGVLGALDVWLTEDAARVEGRLAGREAVAAVVELFARRGRRHDTTTTPQLLDTLKHMLSSREGGRQGRTPKLAVALALGGLVPWLMDMLLDSAPILQAKLLDIIAVLYEHYPRPKEFIMKYRIAELLKKVVDGEGRGQDAVKLQAQKLLNAFHINVLL